MRASKVASSCRPVHGTRPPLEPGGVGGVDLPHRHGRRTVGRSSAGAIAFSGPEGRSEERTPRNRPRPVASVTSSGWGRSVDGPGFADFGGSDPGPFFAGIRPAYSGRTAVPASLVPVTRTDPPSRLPVTAAEPVGSVPDTRPSRWRRLRHRLAIDPTPPPDSTLARPVLRNEVLLVLAVSLGASAVYAVLSLLRKLLAPVPLSQSQATLNGSVVPNQAWLDLVYQLVGIGFGVVPALLAL